LRITVSIIYEKKPVSTKGLTILRGTQVRGGARRNVSK